MTHNYTVHWALSAILVCLAFVSGLMTGRNPELVEPMEPAEITTEYAEPENKTMCDRTDEYTESGEWRPYLAKDETMPPVWEGGASSFYRDDDLGHKCWYENTWLGDGRQYIFAFYCWKPGDSENTYQENDPKPYPL